MSKLSIASIVALTALLVVACGDDETSSPALNDSLARQAITDYAQIVHVSYQDSLTAAQNMDAAIKTFVGAPSQASLDAARTAWLAAREPYLQTEVYRFYGGPIDVDPGGPEGLLNAWPMDEGYVDYVDGNPTSGIINDPTTYPVIDAATIEGLNEADGDENIATGYHAIEFLLWGQDSNATGPGNRPFTDFVTDGNGTMQNQDRRALYLTTASELLITHLQGLVNAWAPNVAGNYRATFEALPTETAIANIMTGMLILTGFETGGERVQAALTSGDQEDEHSCFSDNTHRDMIQDVQGIINVYRGTWNNWTGVGVREVVAASDANLAAAIDAKLNESINAAQAMPVPFDQAIAQGNTQGRAAVELLVTKLLEAEDELERAFIQFGLDIPVAE